MESDSQKEPPLEPQKLITVEDVKKALTADKGQEAQLTSWRIVDFTKYGDNHACAVTSVEVEYSLRSEDGLLVTYVVKLNPCRKSPKIDEVINVVFVKEYKFYSDLLPELNLVLTEAGQDPLRFPACFHSCLDPGKEQIYLEDLRAFGYKMFDRKKGMDSDHLTFVLKELARIHAASYILQAKTPEEAIEEKHDFLLGDWLSFTEDSKEIFGPMLRSHLTNAIEMLRTVGGYDTAISWIEGLEQRLDDVLTTGMQSERFGSVCHGDCWNNNVLFRYNDRGIPIDVMLLDLQSCRKASLASDLNYFMYTSLTGDVRRPNLQEFLSLYHSSYRDVLEAGGHAMHFTHRDLLEEFRDKNVLGAFFGMMILPVALMEAEEEEVPDTSGRYGEVRKIKLGRTMSEVRTKAAGEMVTHPMMGPRFLSIFDELLENGVIS